MNDPSINAGCRTLAVSDDVQGARVPVYLLYPTNAAPRTATFGAYTIDVAFDAPLVGERLPLVAISHGKGGTPWGYGGLASRLAREGFVVALIEHPGNSRNDNSLDGKPENLANRPRHVRLALSAAFADAAIGPGLLPDRAAVIGHSMGGYTALAVAGGHPIALPEETSDGVAHPISVEPDPRVRAVVLLAPALPWFLAPGALADVRVPLMMRTGERDEYIPPEYIDFILRGLPEDARLDSQIIPGAGHFAFLWPMPPSYVSSAFLPAQDPPGFDRAAYQPQFHREVLAFLRANLL